MWWIMMFPMSHVHFLTNAYESVSYYTYFMHSYYAFTNYYEAKVATKLRLSTSNFARQPSNPSEARDQKWQICRLTDDFHAMKILWRKGEMWKSMWNSMWNPSFLQLSLEIFRGTDRLGPRVEDVWVREPVLSRLEPGEQEFSLATLAYTMKQHGDLTNQWLESYLYILI